MLAVESSPGITHYSSSYSLWVSAHSRALWLTLDEASSAPVIQSQKGKSSETLDARYKDLSLLRTYVICQVYLPLTQWENKMDVSRNLYLDIANSRVRYYYKFEVGCPPLDSHNTVTNKTGTNCQKWDTVFERLVNTRIVSGLLLYQKMLG